VASKRIILTGDWHIGAGSVDFEELTDVAKRYFKGHPVILLGDLVDMGLDKGMNFSNKMQPQDQIDKVEEIAELLDICGYCIGNHDARIFKKTGLNPYKQIFKQKPSHTFKLDGREIYFNHGRSAADHPFLEHSKYAKWAGCDVIALGHSHVLAYLPIVRYGKLNFYVRTGSFLGAEDYAVENGYQPLIKGWAEYDTKTNRIYLKMLEGKEAIDI
jgi:predicted phosphodiesterase